MRAVDVRAKRDVHPDEPTRYRYEAVLHTAEPVADLSGAPVLRWGQDVSSAAGATALLEAARPAVLRLSAVPNPRLQDLEGTDPEELCAAGEIVGYLALPTWSAQGAALLDIVYVDPDQVPAGPLTGVYAAAAVAERTGTQPGSPIQEIVRDLFAEVLEVPRSQVFADSDFFRTGGHAPAAARLLSRVRATLGADPGSRALYEAPTPAAFAALLGDGPVAAAGPVRSGADSAVLPLRLRGALNQRALDEALEDLGNRHEALRNSRIGSAGTRLRTLSPDDHLLDLALPATSVDLWSHLPLAAELARAYGARATGGTPHRAPAGLDAAPRALFGDTPPTLLPGGSVPLPHDSCGTVEVELDDQLHTRLAEFAAAHGTTLFMVAHAALAALLSRLGAGDADGHVTVAAQVPARHSAGLCGAVGPYGRTLALSVDTSGDAAEPTFGELLHRVRTTDLAAYRDGASALALPGGVALTVLQEPAGRFEAAGLTVWPEHPQLPWRTPTWESHSPNGRHLRATARGSASPPPTARSRSVKGPRPSWPADSSPYWKRPSTTRRSPSTVCARCPDRPSKAVRGRRCPARTPHCPRRTWPRCSPRRSPAPLRHRRCPAWPTANSTPAPTCWRMC